MTTAEAKRYLSSARYAQMRLDALDLEAERQFSSATSGVAKLDGMPHGSADPHEPTRLDVLADLLTDIEAERAQLRQTYQEVRRVVYSVEEPYKTLLHLRYFCGATWEDIAEKMSYDVRTVYRLHGAALGKVVMVCHGLSV